MTKPLTNLPNINNLSDNILKKIVCLLMGNGKKNKAWRIYACLLKFLKYNYNKNEDQKQISSHLLLLKFIKHSKPLLKKRIIYKKKNQSVILVPIYNEVNQYSFGFKFLLKLITKRKKTQFFNKLNTLITNSINKPIDLREKKELYHLGKSMPTLHYKTKKFLTFL